MTKYIATFENEGERVIEVDTYSDQIFKSLKEAKEATKKALEENGLKAKEVAPIRFYKLVQIR